MRKPMEQVFSEFAGRKPVKGVEGDTYMGSGDVKYHLGTSYDRPTISGAALSRAPPPCWLVDVRVFGRRSAAAAPCASLPTFLHP